MAGLGINVGSSFTLRSRMNGNFSSGGQTYPVWYFTADTAPSQTGFMGDRQLPSSHLELIEGQPSVIELFNQSPMDHTIHLHGMDVDQANDGVPATSFTVPAFDTATYSFVAPPAGTYLYHCHVDTALHFAMGMYGTIIVRPPGGVTNVAWTGGPTFDEEVVWHLHQYDTTWPGPMVGGATNVRWRPDVFFINGKESAEATVDPFTRVQITSGQKAYIRLTNAGYNYARVSLGGSTFDVVATDGRPLPAPLAVTSWELGPGERYDLLFTSTTLGTTTARVEYLNDVTGQVVGVAETVIEVL